MEIKKLFGKNLKYYRFQKGLSQEKLAEAIDSTVTYISNIETGRNGITFGKLEEFCAVLGVKPMQLFDEEIAQEPIIERLDIYQKQKKQG